MNSDKTDLSQFKRWLDEDFDLESELQEVLYTDGHYRPISDRMLAVWNVMLAPNVAESGSAYHEIFKSIAYAGWCAGVDAAAKGLSLPPGDVLNAAWDWLDKDEAGE